MAVLPASQLAVADTAVSLAHVGPTVIIPSWHATWSCFLKSGTIPAEWLLVHTKAPNRSQVSIWKPWSARSYARSTGTVWVCNWLLRWCFHACGALVKCLVGGPTTICISIWTRAQSQRSKGGRLSHGNGLQLTVWNVPLEALAAPYGCLGIASSGFCFYQTRNKNSTIFFSHLFFTLNCGWQVLSFICFLLFVFSWLLICVYLPSALALQCRLKENLCPENLRPENLVILYLVWLDYAVTNLLTLRLFWVIHFFVLLPR